MRTRNHIVATAAAEFAAHGMDGIRLDELADRANVARGTLYNYFPTKECLLVAIVRPALEKALKDVSALVDREPRAAIRGFVDLYLNLWRDHEHALQVMYHAESVLPKELHQLHRRYLRLAMGVFNRAATAGMLRCPDARAAAFAMRSVAVPLMKAYQGQPDFASLFRESVVGMLLA